MELQQILISSISGKLTTSALPLAPDFPLKFVKIGGMKVKIYLVGRQFKRICIWIEPTGKCDFSAKTEFFELKIV